MKLDVQKRIAAEVLKVGVNRVWFDEDQLEEIKEAITKTDIRRLVGNKIIQKRPIKGTSRGRARKLHIQKRKGRRKGMGSRQGTQNARYHSKKKWIIKIRNQREFLKELRSSENLSAKDYGKLYLRAKGGFFRNRRHLKLFIEEHNLIQKYETKKNNSKLQKKKTR